MKVLAQSARGDTMTNSLLSQELGSSFDLLTVHIRSKFSLISNINFMLQESSWCITYMFLIILVSLSFNFEKENSCVKKKLFPIFVTWHLVCLLTDTVESNHELHKGMWKGIQNAQYQSNLTREAVYSFNHAIKMRKIASFLHCKKQD